MKKILLFCRIKEKLLLLQPNSWKHACDSVAQLVEQMTLNHWVEGSSPSGVTLKVKQLTNRLAAFFLCVVAIFG